MIDHNRIALGRSNSAISHTCVLCKLSYIGKYIYNQQGARNIPDLQITHLDDSGKRYLVDVTTVDVTAAMYCAAASRNSGAAAATPEGRKVREYKSKVDGKTTFEMSGRWGEGLISLFKKGVKLATKEEERSRHLCRTMETSVKYHCKKSHDETSPSCTEDLSPR